MDPLFTPLPESLSDLTDEQIDEHVSQFTATFAAIRANDPELLGERTAQQIIEDAKAGKEAYAALKAEKVARAEAVASYEATLAELTSDIEELTADPGDEDPADPADPDASAADPVEEPAVEEPVEEPVVAAVVPRRPLPAPGRHIAVVNEVDNRVVPIVASAGMAGFAAGQPLDRKGLGSALLKAISAATTSRGGEKVVVASADYKDRIPEERRLGLESAGVNNERIDQLVHEVAHNLVAAANPYCAPLAPYYLLQNISIQDRPVRDALAGFVADRGGVIYTPPPSLADLADAVGAVTAGDVVAGGTFSTKSCLTAVCPDITTVELYSVYQCITFQNLRARSYPELVALDNDLAMSQHSRLGDTLLLDAIKAGSTAVTGAANNGAVNSYLGHLLQLAASIRSSNRMDPNARLQVLAPSWTRDLLVLDIARSQFERFAYQQNGVAALLDSFNLNISFYIDGSSDGNQVYSTQGAGAITPFPTTVETFMFPAGTWLFLDGGTLDLGIVRDSVLNAQNEFQLFSETFEAAAKVGVVSYVIESTLCPSGAVTAPGAAIGC